MEEEVQSFHALSGYIILWAPLYADQLGNFLNLVLQGFLRNYIMQACLIKSLAIGDLVNLQPL